MASQKGAGWFFISRIPAVMKEKHRKVQTEVNRTAVKLVAATKRNARGRPGPRVQTGFLISSIVPMFAEGLSTTARVEVRAPYAAHVEFETRNSPEYPYFRPAILAMRRDHEERIRNI